MSALRYRKKPVVIEAMQWDGSQPSMPSETPRTFEIERDRFGLMYSGPRVGVGEVRRVYEAAPVDAERERMLEVIKRLLLSHPQRKRALVPTVVIEAEDMLRAHGRLSGEAEA